MKSHINMSEIASAASGDKAELQVNAYPFARKGFRAAFLFYFLIAFEFFYMAGPFAVYFYSIYRPGLEFLDNYPVLAHLTGFFLPHLVEDTRSVFLNMLRPAGLVISITGIVAFLICACQVYYARLFNKGVVKEGLYKYIRHPQYTAFALTGFGLLILWPRYLVLIMFITVLFIYYFLARTEERECEMKYGDDYLNYRNTTHMFLPFNFPIARMVRIKILSGRIPRKMKAGKIRPLLVFGLYILLVIISVQGADVLKKFSINNLYSLHSRDDLFIAIYGEDEKHLKSIADILNSGAMMDSLKRTLGINEGLSGYVIPAGMYISEIPMFRPEDAICHVTEQERTTEEIKFVLTRLKGGKEAYSGNTKSRLANALSISPVMEFRIDPVKKKIIRAGKPGEKEIRYKNIPEPLF